MKKLIGIISTIAILLLLCSGAFTEIAHFVSWLFTLQYSQPETSIAGGIIVRMLTFVVSYGLVGFIFGLLGWFNEKCMKIAYFIISTLISFALTYVVWKIEQHILVIGIVLGIVLILTIVALIVSVVISKKKEKNENQAK